MKLRAYVQVKILYTCKACNTPVIDKTPQMACSLCGNGMHLGCGVRNITISLPRRIEWFRRTFRLNLVSYNGRYVHTFPLAATTS